MGMSVDQIKSDLTTALKAGEALRVSVLRMLLSELNYKKIDVQRELNEEDVIAVLQKEVKKRREAIESYTAGGRTEQAACEKEELEILQVYLPAPMTEEEIKTKLKTMNLPSDFGQAMKLAFPAFRGLADGALVAKLVKELV